MDKFDTNDMTSKCENCLRHVREKLLVTLPESLKRAKHKRFKNKEKAYLCFDCVKNHCRTTLSDFWKMFIFPKTKEAIERKERYKK